MKCKIIELLNELLNLLLFVRVVQVNHNQKNVHTIQANLQKVHDSDPGKKLSEGDTD